MRTFMTFLICVSTLAHAQTVRQQRKFIPRIRIAAMYYSSMPWVGVDPESLLKNSSLFAIIDETIYDTYVYQTLDSLIRGVKLETGPGFGSNIDARITCLVYRKQGSPDTVSFGGPQMQINSKLGYLQPGGLLAISEYLPRKFEADIRYYLDSMWMYEPQWPKYGYERKSK